MTKVTAVIGFGRGPGDGRSMTPLMVSHEELRSWLGRYGYVKTDDVTVSGSLSLCANDDNVLDVLETKREPSGGVVSHKIDVAKIIEIRPGP